MEGPSSSVELNRKSHFLSWLFCSRQEPDQCSETQSKSYFDVLLEGIKKIVAAAKVKEEQREKKKKEEDLVEKQARLIHEASDHLRKAEMLRPDLAAELELPQMEFILTSAFSEVPNVDALIDEALRKKANKSHRVE
jgi:DNA uptake protein ComE-like DNA-binding protein